MTVEVFSSRKNVFFYPFSMCLLQKHPPEVFCKKGVLNNFTIFTGKLLCWRLEHTCFPVNIAKIFKNTYFEEHLQTTASVTKALIVLFLSFVLIQTYKIFWLFIFHSFTCKLGNIKIKEHGEISCNTNVTIIWKYKKR